MSSKLALILGLFLPALAVSANELLDAGDFSLEPLGGTGLMGLNADRWGRFTSVEPMLLRVVKTPLGEEGKALRIESRGRTGAYQGFFQIILVQPGARYLVSAQVLNDPDAPLRPGALGILSVEWKDGAGQEIMREDEPAWGHDLSTSAWTISRVSVTAPPRAVYGHFVVLQRDSEDPSLPAGGAFYISRFSVAQK